MDKLGLGVYNPTMSTFYRIEVVPSVDKKWFFRINHANGQTIATSETYTRRWSAMRAAKRMASPFGWDIRVLESQWDG